MIYRSYINSATKRGYEFKLSEDEAFQLFQSNCTYCGIEPKQGMNSLPNTRRISNKFVFNGIDRVDNTVGYITTNCVSCCGRCNLIKGTQTVEEFKEHIKQIYNKMHGTDIV